MSIAVRANATRATFAERRQDLVKLIGQYCSFKVINWTNISGQSCSALAVRAAVSAVCAEMRSLPRDSLPQRGEGLG